MHNLLLLPQLLSTRMYRMYYVPKKDSFRQPPFYLAPSQRQVASSVATDDSLIRNVFFEGVLQIGHQNLCDESAPGENDGLEIIFDKKQHT